MLIADLISLDWKKYILRHMQQVMIQYYRFTVQLLTIIVYLQADECSSSPCLNGGSCINGLNSYKCECVPGSYGINCQSSKRDNREKSREESTLTLALLQREERVN